MLLFALLTFFINSVRTEVPVPEQTNHSDNVHEQVQQKHMTASEAISLLQADIERTVEQTAGIRFVFNVVRTRESFTEESRALWKKIVNFFIKILNFNESDEKQDKEQEEQLEELTKDLTQIHELLKENPAIIGNGTIYFMKEEIQQPTYTESCAEVI